MCCSGSIARSANHAQARDRLEALFGDDNHVEVEATWMAYQQLITAYRCTKRPDGKQILTELIESLRSGVPAGLQAT